MKPIVLGMALLALGGCQTQPVSTMSYAQVMEVAKQINQRCTAQAKPNTPAWDLCVRIEVSREHNMRAQNAANFSRAMSGIGAGLAAAGQNYNNAAMATAARRPVTCSTVPAPTGMATVRCY